MDFALDKNDLQILNGDFAICTDESKATAQAIAIRLKTLAGEWFLDDSIGIPYFSHILGKKYSSSLLKQLIEREIKTVSGVKEIINFELKENAQNRTVVVIFQVTQFDGNKINIHETLGSFI